MSKVDLFVHGQLSKNGYFTCIFGVVHYPMCATSATNVAQNVAQFYLYFKYKCPPATRSFIYRSVRGGTRSQHGEITALEDSKAAPQKLNHQPFAKKQPKYPKYPNFGYL